MQWRSMILAASAILTAFATPARASDDPPSAFSRAVTGLTGDWEADDWRDGTLKAHPTKFTWQSDVYVDFFAEQGMADRSPQAFIDAAFNGTELGDDKVTMAGAKAISDGIFVKTHRWSYAFDENATIFGVVTTPDNRYVGVTAQCEYAHPDSYGGPLCLEKVVRLLTAVRQGHLRIPEPPTPLNVPGWRGSYLPDGTSSVRRQSQNGLYWSAIYTAPPALIAAEAIPAAVARYAVATADEDDKGAVTKAPFAWSNGEQFGVMTRLFPDAMEGPAIQIAGAIKLNSGRISLFSVRCQNTGWLERCKQGLRDASLEIASGSVERRRLAMVADTKRAPLANGLKNAQILGLYTEGHNTMGAGGFMTGYEISGYLYLRDGTVFRDFDRAPAFFDVAASRRDSPAKWGRWQRAGAKLSIRWGDGKIEVVNPENGLMVGGTPGMRLNGTYRHVAGGGSIAFGGGSSFLSEGQYRFFPNGSFKSDQSSSFMTGTVTGEATAMGGGGGTTGLGRYIIDGFSMKLIYPDGRESWLSFAVNSSDLAKPVKQGVMLNGSYYFHDDGK